MILLRILLRVADFFEVIDWLSVAIEAEILFGIQDGTENEVAAIHLFFEEAVVRENFLLTLKDEKELGKWNRFFNFVLSIFYI